MHTNSAAGSTVPAQVKLHPLDTHTWKGPHAVGLFGTPRSSHPRFVNYGALDVRHPWLPTVPKQSSPSVPPSAVPTQTVGSKNQPFMVSTNQRIKPPVQVVQISDPHLGLTPRPLRPGYPDTDWQLQQVLSAIQAEVGRPDLLLVTGDLAQDPESSVYQRLTTHLRSLDCPVLAVAGNHDDPARARHSLEAVGLAFDARSPLPTVNWQVVGLNSAVAEQVDGYLTTTEFERLEAILTAHPQTWTLLAVHHPPVPIDSQWMDAIGLRNGPELLQRLHAYPQVRGVVFGHIHQAFTWLSPHGGPALFGCPSTCVQFRPRSAQFALDTELAGYRVLRLHPDGRLETRVHRVPGTGRLEQQQFQI